jgi:5-methyltetrahydropteroyltriglutamate--homocysteine methyltransferase
MAPSKLSARAYPPFRADHVGSLLRPAQLKAKRTQRERNEISASDLRAAEDLAIEGAVRKQASLGLLGITDGEYRRSYWHFDFLEALQGVALHEGGPGNAFKPKILEVTGSLGYRPHPHVAQFEFLRDRVKGFHGAVAKVCIPSPSVLHYRGGRKYISEAAYPDMAEYFHDLGLVYQQEIAAFAAAGCKYLQLDEVNFTYLCDSDQREMLRARGDDPETLPEVYADLINLALAVRPADMHVTMHLCRGNFRSMWAAQGGYEQVADVLFNTVNVDGYFMEWDTDRAGGFEPLRRVPDGKQVALGLMTSKTGELESKEFLMRRIGEASKYIPLDQLSLSPQCGFASTEEGNTLSEEEQWEKLARLVETAHEVWGF